MPASPQIQDGSTPIANELVEAFSHINLSAYESRIIWFIIRKSYGYHKKTDRISFSQFELGTGLKHWHISRTLARLISRHIIIRLGEGYDLEYGIQKDYELWTEVVPNEVTNISTSIGDKSVPNEVLNDNSKSVPQQGDSVPNEVTKSSPIQVHTKYINILTKDNSIDKPVKESFEDYKERMRLKYPELDFDNELEKWHEYWYEGTLKCKNPKLALHNWLDKARAYRSQQTIQPQGDRGW